MACISAETGTLTFAIINIVLVTLSSVSSVGMLLFWGYQAAYNVDRFQEHPYTNPEMDEELFHTRVELMDSVMQLTAIIVMLTMSLISLMFASFLMNGILKKKPEHIKVYYIYAVVKMVVFTLIVIGASASSGVIDPVVFVVFLVYFSIYSLILYMIRYTYLKIETTNAQFSHKPLVEKC